MNIKIDRFRLEGVSPELTVYETKLIKATKRALKKNIGKEREVVLGYYTSVYGALCAIHERLVAGWTKKTLKSMLVALKRSNDVIVAVARVLEAENDGEG